MGPKLEEEDVATGTRLLLCDCGMATRTQGALIAEAEAIIRAQGLAAWRVSDLCAAVARRDPRLLALARARDLLVVACRPRAVRWLLEAAGLALAAPALDVVDLRQPLAAARAELAARLASCQTGSFEALEYDARWISWFPVVDGERCQRCGQCASYCAFGVYSTGAGGGVSVTRPEGCKTNCPACARLCPSAAIIFPKHDEAPFDGSAIEDEEVVRAQTRRHTHELLGADPYAALAARRERVALLRRRPTARVS